MKTSVTLIKRSDGLLEPFDNKSMDIVEGLPYEPKVFEVSVKRSLSQNAIAAVWYDQIDKQLNQLPGSSRAFCKLTIGVPILRGEDEDFREFYDKALIRLQYEEKLQAMEYVPVTRIMTKEQMTRYLEAVQILHAEQFGIVLESE